MSDPESKPGPTVQARVILIEDDRLLRESIEEWLKRQGCEVASFPDARGLGASRDIVCRCSGNRACADVLISDVRLPDISGIELVEELRRRGCRIQKIALMSGWWTEEASQAAEELGVAVFRKPTDFSTLLRWTREAVATVSRERVLEDHFLNRHNGETHA